MLIQEQKKKEVIMDVRIQAIHFDATAQLEAFIQKKVSKLEQYFDGIILAEVTLKVVKPETVKNKQASIMLSVKNGECFADKINDTFEGAIDDPGTTTDKHRQRTLNPATHPPTGLSAPARA